MQRRIVHEPKEEMRSLVNTSELRKEQMDLRSNYQSDLFIFLWAYWYFCLLFVCDSDHLLLSPHSSSRFSKFHDNDGENNILVLFVCAVCLVLQKHNVKDKMWCIVSEECCLWDQFSIFVRLTIVKRLQPIPKKSPENEVVRIDEHSCIHTCIFESMSSCFALLVWLFISGLCAFEEAG